MPLSIIAQVDLENRMSAAVVGRILDDNNTGVANTAPLAQLLSDGQSRVMGYVRRAYTPLQIQALLLSPPELLKSLCLDACQVYAFERFPTYCRIEPSMIDRVQRDLENVASSRMRIDNADGQTTEPVPANVGGIIESGNPNKPAPRPKTFADGMGDF